MSRVPLNITIDVSLKDKIEKLITNSREWRSKSHFIEFLAFEYFKNLKSEKSKEQN